MDIPMASRPSVLRQAATFGGHFLEMCVAMCAVGTPIVLGVSRQDADRWSKNGDSQTDSLIGGLLRSLAVFGGL